jgi:hypothetical protein
LHAPEVYAFQSYSNDLAAGLRSPSVMLGCSGTLGLFALISRRAMRPRWSGAARAVAVSGLAALACACDGSGGSGPGGAGGGGAGGGGGGTTTTTTTTQAIEACPTQAEPHVLSIVVDPSGSPVWTDAVDIAGTVAGAGLDSPPSAECGSGMAWVTITADDASGDWVVCFQAPSLVWSFQPGGPAELAQTVDVHPIAPATVHTTLRSAGALVVHSEWAMYEEELALPDGVTVARADQVCSSPDDPCKTEGYSVTASAGAETASIQPGESGVVGGLRIYVDHYWMQQVSSACDGGAAHIRMAVTPAP